MLLAGSQQTPVAFVEIPWAVSVAASVVAIECLVSVVACLVELVLAWAASTEMARVAAGSSRWGSVHKVGMGLVGSVGRVQDGTSVSLATMDLPVVSLGLEVPYRLVAMRLVVEVLIVASVSVVVDER